MAEKTPQHPQQAGPESPTQWETREDNYKVAGEYPRQTFWRTQSGHTVMMDDTKDKEHITIQHRGGARIQIGATGDIQIVAHNGMYSVVLGENRMIVTGTQDITVRGGATMKVDGDYDMTVGGNMNFACDNDFNFKGKNFNVMADNMDTQAKNMNLKTEGSIAMVAGGALIAQAESAAVLTSRGSSATVAGATQVGVYAKSGEVAIQSGGETHIYAGGDFNADAPNIWLNSGKAEAATDIIESTRSTKPQRQARTKRPTKKRF